MELKFFKAAFVLVELLKSKFLREIFMKEVKMFLSALRWVVKVSLGGFCMV